MKEVKNPRGGGLGAILNNFQDQGGLVVCGKRKKGAKKKNIQGGRHECGGKNRRKL